jgi:hypothetical protein
MKPRKKPKSRTKEAQAPKPYTPRNLPLHIPLDFEKAVEGLLNTKPKKKPPKQ